MSAVGAVALKAQTFSLPASEFLCCTDTHALSTKWELANNATRHQRPTLRLPLHKHCMQTGRWVDEKFLARRSNDSTAKNIDISLHTHSEDKTKIWTKLKKKKKKRKKNRKKKRRSQVQFQALWLFKEWKSASALARQLESQLCNPGIGRGGDEQNGFWHLAIETQVSGSVETCRKK